jgi:putative sigma-54 modulation protein
MNLTITGHHLEVTPALRDYVTSKLDRVIRHFDNVTATHVILSVEKLKQKADVTVHVRGRDIHVESEDDDLYAAIDAMADKLDRQVVKHKEKTGDHGNVASKRQDIETDGIS